MKRLFALVFLTAACAFAGTPNLVVTAKVADTGRTPTGLPAWGIAAEIRNTSAQPVRATMMSCSWVHSWRIEPEKIFVVRSNNSCESNYPTEYVLPPGGGFRFRFVVASRSLKEIAEGTKLRLGFAHVPRVDDYEKTMEDPAAQLTLLWTDALELPAASDRAIRIVEVREELHVK